MPARRTIETANLGPALSRRPSSEFPLSAAEKTPQSIRGFAQRHGRDVKKL